MIHRFGSGPDQATSFSFGPYFMEVFGLDHGPRVKSTLFGVLMPWTCVVALTDPKLWVV
jgi:hypothetical protein